MHEKAGAVAGAHSCCSHGTEEGHQRGAELKSHSREEQPHNSAHGLSLSVRRVCVASGSPWEEGCRLEDAGELLSISPAFHAGQAAWLCDDSTVTVCAFCGSSGYVAAQFS